MSSLIRVGVLDEQEVVRYGLSAYLADQNGIAVPRVYGNTGSALDGLAQTSVNLLVMDPRVAGGSGHQFINILKARHPELRILAYLVVASPSIATLLLSSGFDGVVCKREPLYSCVHAIRLLAAGHCYPGISLAGDESVSSGVGYTEAAFISHPSLSIREREVLRLCISGLTVTKIAEISHRSLKTVSTQKQAAYRKLGLKSDIDLFRKLSRYGA